MSFMSFTDPDEAIARVARQVAEAEERARVARDFADRAEAVRGRAVSRDRTIAIDVDSNGGLLGITLDDDALSVGGKDLAQEILRLAQDAKTDAARKMKGLAIEAFGEDSDLIGVLGLDSDARDRGFFS